MLHAVPSGSEEDLLPYLLPYMGMAVLLVMWHGPFIKTSILLPMVAAREILGWF